MKDVIIYGAGGTGKNILHEVQKKYHIQCFVDSDERKWGKFVENIEILNPDLAIKQKKYDYIIIASAPGLDTISEKLIEMGVNTEKIITSYVLLPLESRRQFLADLAELYLRDKIKGSCAEAGVFEGDFAKYINQYFPEKKLYLFDTFEGFAEKDIKVENQVNASVAQKEDYNYTSIDMVKRKMTNIEKVIIVKGYFPDSACNIEDEFCFVNLDLDLYQPTINGLMWFGNKMVAGGVILVHDYFSSTFKGPRLAVDEFLGDNSHLKKFPIGDGVSILITGF